MRMKNYMRKSAAFSHVFFTFAFTFLLFLCFFRYLRLTIVLSVLFALAAACCAAALLAAFLGRKRQKLLFSLRAEKEKEALALYLSLISAEEILRFFAQAFPERFSRVPPRDVSSVGENLFFLHAPQNGKNADNGKVSENGKTEERLGEPCFFSFSAKNFSLENSENLLRFLGGPFEKEVRSRDKKSPARAQLYCAGTDEEAAALLDAFGVKCVTLDEIFAAAKTLDVLPEAVTTLADKKKKQGFKLRAANRKTARGLLLSAGILLFTSLFSPFPYYYRAMGLILLALSLAVRLLATGAKLPAFRRAAPPEDNAHENNSIKDDPPENNAAGR